MNHLCSWTVVACASIFFLAATGNARAHDPAGHGHNHTLTGQVAVEGSLVEGVMLAQADRQPPPRPAGGLRIVKPSIDDTITANMYADNWFAMYINGKLVAVDSIAFMPHNVVSVDILPEYPMTIAVMAKDNADAVTGMEYNNTQIGDAGFILKFGDGTVTNAAWKAKAFSHGPVNGDTRDPKVRNTPLPENWFAVDFDDSGWPRATEFNENVVRPKKPFYDHDFKGARFIWSDNLELDNTVLLRHTVKSPPDGKARPSFKNLGGSVDPNAVAMSNPAPAQPATGGSSDNKPGSSTPLTAQAFEHYPGQVRTHWDDDYVYVESNGLPDHEMMVGITAWQQQVPLPQDYTGNNAWQIPLKPIAASKPQSAKDNFFRGGIAVAVIGIPIFNPIKNDGKTDTNLAGELDEFGGHAGRADDYHYHMPPVFLEEHIGPGKPIAFALDGYPIYGYNEPDGKPAVNLDWLNGHTDAEGNYHYHSTRTLPLPQWRLPW